ncbi:DUF6090 family protein [Winogradskyella sp.]|uniref:DUF6090 family protein n=1 Tax=Winogradskyella sp. TaxID=1883156 RepID=UPI003AB362FB
MIKFFRKIRQNLLSERKTGKYFKYALGEVILVVVGILIALQINNWNDSRKENKIKNNYYNRLLVDLEADKAYANRYISRIDSSLAVYDKYRKSYEKPNLSLTEILTNLGKNNVYTLDLQYQTSTIETLINTGDLQILDSRIIDLVTKYNGQKNQTELLSRDNKRDATDLLKNFALRGGVMTVFNNFPNQPELFKNLNFEDRIPDVIIAFEAFVVWKREIDRTNVKMLTENNKTADSIIEIINLELKK